MLIKSGTSRTYCATPYILLRKREEKMAEVESIEPLLKRLCYLYSMVQDKQQLLILDHTVEITETLWGLCWSLQHVTVYVSLGDVRRPIFLAKCCLQMYGSQEIAVDSTMDHMLQLFQFLRRFTNSNSVLQRIRYYSKRCKGPEWFTSPCWSDGIRSLQI